MLRCPSSSAQPTGREGVARSVLPLLLPMRAHIGGSAAAMMAIVLFWHKGVAVNPHTLRCMSPLPPGSMRLAQTPPAGGHKYVTNLLAQTPRDCPSVCVFDANGRCAHARHTWNARRSAAVNGVKEPAVSANAESADTAPTTATFHDGVTISAADMACIEYKKTDGRRPARME